MGARELWWLPVKLGSAMNKAKTLKIASLNCGSLKDTGRFSELYRWVVSADIDVLLAQDTGINHAQANKLKNTYPAIDIEVPDLV